MPGKAMATRDLLSLAGDDPDVKDRVVTLCKMVLEDAMMTMIEGDPVSRAAMTRLLLPTVAGMMTSGPNAEAQKLREEIRDMYKDAFGQTENMHETLDEDVDDVDDDEDTGSLFYAGD